MHCTFVLQDDGTANIILDPGHTIDIFDFDEAKKYFNCMEAAKNIVVLLYSTQIHILITKMTVLVFTRMKIVMQQMG